MLSTEPFANDAQDVDASVKVITIVLEKPLDPGAGYSVSPGIGGKKHYPLTGKPTFTDGGLRILLPVQLQPNQTYSFALTQMAFPTRDGYPLSTFSVDFKTK